MSDARAVEEAHLSMFDEHVATVVGVARDVDAGEVEDLVADCG